MPLDESGPPAPVNRLITEAGGETKPEAWMICAPDPGSRATLRLEIIVPESSGLTAVGPGKLAKRWTKSGEIHFLYEQSEPVQTFLFSFAVSKLVPTRSGNLIAYAESAGHTAPLAITADAAAFFRGKTGVDAIAGGYTQVFVQQRGLAQESANLALMSEDYLRELEQKDDVLLLAHELAHQWWARLAGIRSWSDFWLNEGFAEFMSLAYLEHRKGRAAYQDGIAKLTSRMKELPDRPLHFEKWKTAREALGPVPYVKGALFLHRLRTALGDELFWRGLALYTRANAGTLVDSSDFQRAMEEASGRDLGAMFTEAGAVL